MVLVGPSGSGKTTMIKMINRLLEPTDGNIYMDGKRIKDYDERELRLSTGYVLQAVAPPLHLRNQGDIFRNR